VNLSDRRRIWSDLSANETRQLSVRGVLLSLLLIWWAALELLLMRALPPTPFVVMLVAGSATLVYFLATWGRTNVRLVTAIFGVAVTATLFGEIPWETLRWCQLARPWEAFVAPHLAMVSLALVLPASPLIGILLVGLFATECVVMAVYMRSLGFGFLVPALEPCVSIELGFIGVGLLVLRAQRNTLTNRHVRLLAETDALRTMAPLRQSMRAQLPIESAAIAAALSRLRAPATAIAYPAYMDRALARISALQKRLDALDRPTAVALDEAEPGGGGASAEAESPPPDSGTAPTGSERLLLAREATLGATILGVLTVITVTLFELSFRAVQAEGLTMRASPSIGAAVGILNLVMMGLLLLPRPRPSERRALAFVAVVLPILLFATSYNQAALLALDRPFEALAGHRALMVIIALVFARRLWLAISLVVGVWLVAMGLYFGLHLGAHKDILPLAEPWPTIAFMFIGVVACLMREDRRLAEVRLLHAECEKLALQRREDMYFAVRDLLNSPLQTLVAGMAQLKLTYSDAELREVEGPIDRLVGLSRRLHR
jgi:hypothetical protein